ncbi:mannose-6-phosphate isomerase, class I [Clavibacter tessellarius]|uniref:mannose-6-phosphate isomerase n=1 Tax=Clavibacter tessellarius TaxID=31965 RepID=A0A154V0S2_9MICO|nr:mannose-6-phosphate isomerase, class I [Clavibacter michiganensis]KZC94966.1 mannose-6-phosphate isomerase [Clavibacter michiganensis subsp. tessellarius]
MFTALSNTPRDYAWGSTTAIAELLGREPSGGPEAELWLGAHGGSPTRVDDPATAGGATTLADWIRRDPATTLGPLAEGLRPGDGPGLPFLLKVLAAGGPLSLQAHPDLHRARRGFRDEEERGIPIDAPHRNYKDPLHKPELIYALSDEFHALCGFRPLAEVRQVFTLLLTLDASGPDSDPAVIRSVLSRLTGSEADVLRDVFAFLMGGGAEVRRLVDRVTLLASLASDRQCREFGTEMRTVRELAAAYPGDPGIVTSLLLNRVTLRRGEALYLPAGNIHAYLHGLGIELMAASDNVLRGGLTPKHVDVPELLDVLEFQALPVPYLAPEHTAPGVELYRPDVPDFLLARISPATREATPGDAGASVVEVDGPAIVLCTSGEVALRGETSSVVVRRGGAVFVTPDEGRIVVTGEGEAFLATTPAPSAAAADDVDPDASAA